MICDESFQLRISDLGKKPEAAIAKFGLDPMVTTTPCNFGGVRYWFLCPRCKQRCGILYPNRCRKCAKGRYRSELLPPDIWKIRKALKLRASLGQKHGGISAPFPENPKWMRWKTYERIIREAQQLETIISADIGAWLASNYGAATIPDEL